MYTIAGSLPLLILVCFIGLNRPLSVVQMTAAPLGAGTGTLLLPLVAFLVKLPIVGFHM